MKTKTKKRDRPKHDRLLTKFSRSVSEMQAALIECRGLLEAMNREAANDPPKDKDTRLAQERLTVLGARVAAVLDRYQATIGEMKRPS